MDENLLRELKAAATPATAAVLERALRASRLLARMLEHQPAWARASLAAGDFEATPAQPAAARLAAVVPRDADLPAMQRALRLFRGREMAHLIVRDVAGWAVVDETLARLSELAEAACEAVLTWVMQDLARRRHPCPQACTPIVLGMGKLGGRELNFSSDIDLIFAYRVGPSADGDVAHEYFARVVREVTPLLAEATEDGFVFRVDTLLRPFGRAGAPALSDHAMLAYYQNHGREWERYALIKARPVAGDRAAGAALLAALQVFVYRRYLDFSAIGALRDLKARIDAEARKHGAAEDIKLGPGGIRELEFVVQLFQLVRGGQDARLRDTSLRTTLAQLGVIGTLDTETVRQLDAAYSFLRRIENALQYYDDQQTHRLPGDAAARTALCAALDFADWPALQAVLGRERRAVRAAFDRVFAADSTPQEGSSDEPHAGLWTLEGTALTAHLAELGYRHDPQHVAAQLLALRESRTVRVMSEAARNRLRECIARLSIGAVALEDPETAFCRALQVVAAIGGRSTYLALLCESAATRTQLLRLTASSPWITQLLEQSPVLLDALLDSRFENDVPKRDGIFADLARRAGGVDGADTEASMELLRRYRQETMLRIAAADLSGRLPLVQVSDRLTWLAEAVLDKALADATVQLSARYGQALRADGTPGAFAAVAYGKFGSIELGYGSDLDLVFVFDVDDPAADTQGGPRSLSAAEYYGRLGQRVVQLLSALTGAGRAYEIDLELRPSGSSGAVVSSFSGWARYQRESAWTWEHQALLRARPVAGDAALGEAVNAVRREVLVRPRDAQVLRREVREMRTKVRAGLEQRQAGRWDVKQGVGGLVDAEFLVQYLLLRDMARAPELVIWTDNWRQLDALAAAGVIPQAEAETLVTAGRAYRNWLHRCALQEAGKLAMEAQFTTARADVVRLWQRYLGDENEG
ncbi:MAG: bifunctional [glutamate--ammonia ligase]-adenylyl-L-tyrosine phosphorylase/[glutamate--ammonia-ligase] adenylyltransferase [Nevskiaceae bacterium]|nr:MAG: bifunctional [glutamate--ammonia ligase]-adenylyl-L-tyrosine phosphorylase/[glutamate--ammonia-ligase] adenylyltransferase [Nevskiaceae bacterium]TBR71355.1 MAG: bifunctional [glutamate--ammonia ligase]-adenylyl-L-tyrosine phosphorylase/[glutamate--ammonia-ligase] adenylyltransferase [Nevskiaceae bacterium]